MGTYFPQFGGGLAGSNAQLAVGGPSLIQFVPNVYSVSEEDGSVTLFIARSGTGSGAAQITWSLNDGTATAGTDYTDDTNTLSWADGELSTKSFSVTIIDRDLVQQGDLSFTADFVLDSGLDDVANTSADINITDEDVGTLFWLGTSATGDGSGSDASNRMTLPNFNAESTLDKVGVLGNGTYSDNMFPDSSGSVSNVIRYRAENMIASSDTETIRNVVCTDRFQPTSGYFSVEGVDFDTDRGWVQIDKQSQPNAHHIVMKDCRWVRPWYNKYALMQGTNHSFRNTNQITFENCFVWGNSWLSEQHDLSRVKAGSNAICLDGCEFIYSNHDMVSFRGDSGDTPDWSTPLSSRDVGHDCLVRNTSFKGWEHPFAVSGGAYNVYAEDLEFRLISRSDYRGTAAGDGSRYYGDQTETSSGTAIHGEAVRVWSGHLTMIRTKIFESGSISTNDRVTSISMVSKDNGGSGPADSRRCEQNRFAHITTSRNYGAVLMESTENTGGDGEFEAGRFKNCIFPDDHLDGARTSTQTQYVDGSSNPIAVWMYENEPWTNGGYIQGSVVGNNPANHSFRYHSGSYFTTSEAITEAWADFPVTNCVAGDPEFTDSDNYNVTLGATSAARDQGVAIDTMSGAGVDTNTGTFNDPRWFHDGLGCITFSDFNDGSQPGSTVWVAKTGGGFQETTVTSVDYATGAVTFADTFSWDNGAAVHLVEPDGSGNVDAGAEQAA